MSRIYGSTGRAEDQCIRRPPSLRYRGSSASNSYHNLPVSFGYYTVTLLFYPSDNTPVLVTVRHMGLGVTPTLICEQVTWMWLGTLCASCEQSVQYISWHLSTALLSVRYPFMLTYRSHFRSQWDQSKQHSVTNRYKHRSIIAGIEKYSNGVVAERY